MSDIELAILRILQSLPVGRSISRDELLHEVRLLCDRSEDDKQIDDRMVRKAIQTLRREHPIGARIVALSKWDGYKLARSWEDFEQFKAQERRRADTILEGLAEQEALLRPQLPRSKVVGANGRTSQLEMAL